MQTEPQDQLKLGKEEWQSLFQMNGKNQSLEHRPNIVILGSGFGGLWAARTLADAPVHVLLIDKHNYHTFFPLLYQVGTAELEPEDIAHPVRKIFWRQSNVRFLLSEVQGIDLAAKVVRTTDHEIQYDFLVIALGSEPNFYNIPGAEEYAFTLKSLDQGVVLRDQILSNFEHAACEVEPGRKLDWLTFTIVGGGPTGVEFAGALMELIHGSLDRDFPNLDLRQVQVILLEASDQLLAGMPSKLSRYAQRRLQKMGVEVHLKSQVIEISPHEIRLKDGTRIASRTVIWTAGVHGNIPKNQWGLATNRHSQVEVLPTLQTPDHPEVYIVGDLAGIQQDGHPLPMVAQVGIQTGTTAGKNILRQLKGQTPLPFRYHDKGSLDVIGRNAAAAYIWKRTFTGFPAWMIWAGVHIFNLIGFRNRLLVLINWAWAYLFSEHGVRLIIPSEVSKEKEPGPIGIFDKRENFIEVDLPNQKERAMIFSDRSERNL